ncbi:hypothetical protein E2C01_040111 [Portunus trituberculatus]|uniref:Uncharacterized protein n=1 Tax=Portunus trituberculatus TaxID=210409 RepID=A0A5B7FME8_PORTR|nr:hypothetical protein [Portunus trituberculatus]
MYNFQSDQKRRSECDSTRQRQPSMTFKNVHGEEIYVDVRLKKHSNNKRAVEVNVSGGRIQFLPWIRYTLILTVMAFVIQFHTLHKHCWLLQVLAYRQLQHSTWENNIHDLFLGEQRVLFYMALLVKEETAVPNQELIPLYLGPS